MSDRYITKDEVVAWWGSDHMDVNTCMDMLTSIINNRYTVSEFRKDVIQYADDNKEEVK